MFSLPPPIKEYPFVALIYKPLAVPASLEQTKLQNPPPIKVLLAEAMFPLPPPTTERTPEAMF